MQGPIHALVVDDDADSRNLLMAILEEFGAASVTLAESGHEALDALDGHPATNLMLCDLRMPDVDGLALLRELPRNGVTPALVLISAVDDATLNTARRAALARGLPVLGAVPKHLVLERLGPLLQEWQQAGRPAEEHGAGRIGGDDLRQALDTPELSVLVRPVVRLATGETLGAEILPGWSQPGVARSDPDSLLATADRHELRDALLSRLFHAGGAASSQWEDAGLNLFLLFPLHPDALANLAFPDQAQRQLGAHWLRPEHVVLRYSAAMADANPAHFLDVVARLRVMRFELALEISRPPTIDDLPFQIMWLDPTLTAGVPANPECRSRIQALVHLAESHEARVLASGVDRADQLEPLLDLGCQLAIGEACAPLMTPAAVPDWIARRARRFAPTGHHSDNPASDRD